ncbi:Cyclin B-like protein [Giardia muris]|uniref:Cyclin B-like protein n=1 Tax=Giardia muris TaxID=5742 RepID=A0A4Z1T907_GIAMU|nr:Cyclin B-like protein [Giardia muris]|eukprot:TNJ29627.1 Cyclin B-like protein [Giardia muris]
MSERKYERARSNQARCKTPYTHDGDLSLSSLQSGAAEQGASGQSSYLMFSGVAGVFLDQINAHLGYSAPINTSTVRTPVGTIIRNETMAKVWPRAGPRYRGCIGMGDSLLKSSVITNVPDTASTSLRMMRDYGEEIMRVTILQDDAYHAQGLFGRPDYLNAVQAQTLSTLTGTRRQGYPVGLLQPQGHSSTSFRARSRSSSVGSTSVSMSQSFQSVYGDSDVVKLKDVMKGIDYICQVVCKESYALETQYLACSMFHRFMSACQITKNDIRLLSGVCIFVATKFEENYGEALGSTAICAYFADKFTTSEVLNAELRFLEMIDWRINVSSLNPRAYLRPLFRDLGLSEVVRLLASYLAELTLLDPRFLQYRNFEIALACVELAVLSEYANPLHKGLFRPRTCKNFSNAIGQMFLGMTSSDVEGGVGSYDRMNKARKRHCREDVFLAWKDSYSGPRTTQIFKKYAEPAYFEVSVKITPFDSVEEVIAQLERQFQQSK